LSDCETWSLAVKGFVEQQCAGEIIGVKEEESVNTVLIASINEMARTAYI